jgi:hypothetical protein
MGKPWDKLCYTVKPVTKIGSGRWKTTGDDGANVEVESVALRRATISIVSQQFYPHQLRELAEFCGELANQLDKTS